MKTITIRTLTCSMMTKTGWDSKKNLIKNELIRT